ncbi:MAG: hypothetical protein U0359_05650 [Byssovorax sp.]
MRSTAALALALSAAIGAVACSSAPVAAPASAPRGVDTTPAAKVAAPPASASAAPESKPKQDENRARVMAMTRRVSQARGLPVLREVGVKTLDRAQILAKIREHVEKEIPPATLEHEGEALAALELIPDDYDYLKGSYALIQGRIAGFYEPLDQTMYLVDDLDEDEADETLAHELVHALQDQSFSIGPTLSYKPGQGDRAAAAHALIEGDATSAMFDVVAGSAFNVDERLFSGLVAASTALSAEGAATPHLLQASLASPYTDGFRFVQALRGRGDWAAVDGAFRRLPASTEQLLHPSKYDGGEAPIEVSPPAPGPLGEGFRAVLDDVMGEQGMRLGFAEWAHRDRAAAAAEGWGGDHYIVARRDPPGASTAGGEGSPHQIAVGWRMVFDTARDATEAAALLGARFGQRCRERPRLGPLAWKVRGAWIALAAGPYERTGLKARSAGSCALAERWVDAMLAQPAPTR